MTLSFEKRLDWVEKNVKAYVELQETYDLESGIDEYRLRKRSAEYSNKVIWGVRDV